MSAAAAGRDSVLSVLAAASRKERAPEAGRHERSAGRHERAPEKGYSKGGKDFAGDGWQYVPRDPWAGKGKGKGGGMDIHPGRGMDIHPGRGLDEHPGYGFEGKGKFDKGCWKGDYDMGYGPYDGAPDFGKGGWGPDPGYADPGYGYADSGYGYADPGYFGKGGDFGKGHDSGYGRDGGFTKGGGFAAGYDTGHRGDFPMKGCKKGKFGKDKGPVEVCERIWIGGLPQDATAERVSEFFSSFGTVSSVDLKKDKEGLHKGFGFVLFDSIDGAEAVLCNPALEFHGKWIDCKVATPPDQSKKQASEKVFVNNLPLETTEDALCFHFSQYGSVASTALKHDPVTGAFRGFAFVVFESVEDAQFVLGSPEAAEFEGVKLGIRAADAESAGKGKEGGKGKDFGGKGKGKGKDGKSKGKEKAQTTIWVGCIPLDASGEHVREYFEQYGAVADVTLEYDEMGVSRGEAHVDFQDGQAAKSVLAHYESKDGMSFDPLEWGSGVLLDIKAADKEHGDVPITERIFVGGLSPHMKQDEVSSFYAQYGAIRDIVMKCDSDGVSRGFCYITYKHVESAKKALEQAGGNGMGTCRPYAAESAGKGAGKSAGKPPTGRVLKITGLPSNPKERDVFKFFYSYSTTRIRDTGDDILIEFANDAECKKAFQEKVGKRMGSHDTNLTGGTLEEMAAAGERMKNVEQNKGGGKGGYGSAPSGKGGQRGPY